MDKIFKVFITACYLPKTLFRVVVSPNWTLSFIEEQESVPGNDRYEGYTPPLSFFLFLGVIPIFLAIIMLAYLTDFSRPDDLEGISKKTLAIASIIFSAFPLGFGLASYIVGLPSFVLSASGRLKQMVLVQFYLCAPLFLVFWGLLASIGVRNRILHDEGGDGWSKVVYPALLIGVLVHHIVAEVAVFSRIQGKAQSSSERSTGAKIAVGAVVYVLSMIAAMYSVRWMVGLEKVMDRLLS